MPGIARKEFAMERQYIIAALERDGKADGDGWTIVKEMDGRYTVWAGDHIESRYLRLDGALEDVEEVECADGTRLLRCQTNMVRGDFYPREECAWLDYLGRYELLSECVFDYDGEPRLLEDCEQAYLAGYGEEYVLSSELEESWEWCEGCERYVLAENYDRDYELCFDCVDDRYSGSISEYHSHDKDRWYGDTDKCGERGLGFELEVDKNPSSDEPRCPFNQDFTASLMEKSGLDEEECVYETDASLDTGFEIISMPHTVEDFWRKSPQWGKMLDLLRDAGYKSHDAGDCGLHVHVSRRMFGSTERRQDLAIGKIRKLYRNRWDDLVKASRRKQFHYCGQNEDVVYLPPKQKKDGSTDILRSKRLNGSEGASLWAKVAKGDHYSAINDHHGKETVEFRLGRGTLNKRSFFAWIDLTLALVRNSKKSDKALLDAREWLKGIRMFTAEYLLSRGAFVYETRSLFPEAEWAGDTTDFTVD